MTANIDTLSAWIAVPVIILLLIGSLIALIGALGLLRLPDFYQRIHGPAITITFGTGSILIASMIYFTGLQERLVIHELLITAFVLLTAPVTSMMIMRAAVYRDLRNDNKSSRRNTSLPEAEHPADATESSANLSQPPAKESPPDAR